MSPGRRPLVGLSWRLKGLGTKVDANVKRMRLDMDKEEFLKTTSRIVCNEGGGKLALKVISALKSELGEQLAVDVQEFDFGTSCHVSLRGHEEVFGYRGLIEDGTPNNRTPEDFALMVANRIKTNDNNPSA